MLRDDLFARIDAIAPTLEADLALGDELRRLPDSCVEALVGAGLLRLKVPTVLGGDEAEPGLQFDVFERVAVVNVAAAWCLFIWADSVGAACAYLPDEGVARLLGDGDVPVVCGGGGLRPGVLRTVEAPCWLRASCCDARRTAWPSSSTPVSVTGAGDRRSSRRPRCGGGSGSGGGARKPSSPIQLVRWWVSHEQRSGP